MSSPPDPSSTPSSLPPFISPKLRKLLAIGGGVLVVVVAAIAVLRPPARDTSIEPSAPEPGVAARGYADKRELSVSEVAAASVWIDVTSPAALRTVLRDNAWLKSTIDEPLGRGFLGGWAGLLGTAADDVGLQKLSQGLVADLIADHVLVQPTRLTWFAGWGGGAPAAIIPAPEAALVATFEALKAGLERGGFIAPGCPGEPTPPTPPLATDGVDAGVTAPIPNPNRIDISRLLVADVAIYAAHTRGRLVFSKDEIAVMNAVCAAVPVITATAGSDVVVAMAPDHMGRDVHALTALLGLGKEPTLTMRVDGSRLVPVGIAVPLAKPGRLEATSISKDTWKLVPEDVPVTVGLNLRLPKTLGTAELAKFWQTDADDGLVARQALVLWQPRGDRKAATEVAVVWSDVADRAGLEEIFRGNNTMTVRTICDRVVVSSSTELMGRMEAACTGTAPSMLFAQPAVVSGITGPWSVGVVVDSGKLLSELMMDSWRKDAAAGNGKKSASPSVPPEIDEARKRLLELPRVGFVGTRTPQGATEQVLAPRGFSS